MRKSRSKDLRNQRNLPTQPSRTPLDRFINQIRHSAQKRAVVVEGKTDRRIYQWMRDRVGTGWARVWYAGSISQLLDIYAQKTTLFEKRGIAVAFMADRDLERLFCTNPQPGDIVWTEGYCIENDLYEGFVKDLEDLLEHSETEEFQEMRDAIVEWFAFEVEVFSRGEQTHVGKDLDCLVPKGQTNIDPNILLTRGFSAPNEVLVDKLKGSYNLTVAGKLLFQMLARFLDDSTRRRRYPGSQTYTLKQMYELAGKNTSNRRTQRLISEIEEELTKQAKAINAKKSRSGKWKASKRKSPSSGHSFP